MFRKSASLIVAVAALTLAPVLSTEAVAQSRERSRDREEQSQPSEPQQRRAPRVSPDEARRSGQQYGRPIDTRPRGNGDYSVLVEREGRVREVVVDGQTGRARQSSDNR